MLIQTATIIFTAVPAAQHLFIHHFTRGAAPLQDHHLHTHTHTHTHTHSYTHYPMLCFPCSSFHGLFLFFPSLNFFFSQRFAFLLPFIASLSPSFSLCPLYLSHSISQAISP